MRRIPAGLKDKKWKSDTYLAPDVYISIFVQQSSHYLHMTSSHSSNQHRLSILKEFKFKLKQRLFL